jgi:hypothetical protein
MRSGEKHLTIYKKVEDGGGGKPKKMEEEEKDGDGEWGI